MTAEAVRLSDMAIGHPERLLPVADELAPLLTQPGLVPGSALAAQGPGALTLATAFAAEVSRAGGWVTAVGLGRMGVSAVAERGASLDRWVFVDEPGDAAAEVLNALVGNVDVILLAAGVRLAAAHSRRLAHSPAGAGDRGDRSRRGARLAGRRIRRIRRIQPSRPSWGRRIQPSRPSWGRRIQP